MQKWLADGFEYGLWASSRWMDALPLFHDRAKAEKVLGHVVFAETVWLDRILGRPLTYSGPDDQPVPTLALFEESCRHWLQWLSQADLEYRQTFTRFDGTRHDYRLADVARHVINHGTYHRGHLRGLADAEGWDGFEETDWVAWLRATGASTSV